MKWVKLSIAGLLAAGLAISFADGKKKFMLYRCWRSAYNPIYCYSKKPFDFSADFFGMRYEGNTRDRQDLDILAFGAYEKSYLFFMRDVLRRVAPDRNGIFVDVGANRGQHSLFMSQYAKEVHAFEPYQPIVDRFRHQLKINNVKNVGIYPVGLGDRPAKIPFFSPGDETNQGTGSFIETFSEKNKKYHELEIAVGDEVLEKAGVQRIDVIKIDVEGYERPVLIGLRRSLVKNRPIVEFELTTGVRNDVGFKSMDEIVNTFPDGYKFGTLAEIDKFTGAYQMEPLRGKVPKFDFDGRLEMIAYPAEKESLIPFSGPK
ncbi:MAG TPA: FkbM family methyltransferase [Candidatus Acidoferrales bacterium]|nr:FkbM family methyltransferase [Candidatus Acidoferrales bacterium]